jgi:hypothetical protein
MTDDARRDVPTGTANTAGPSQHNYADPYAFPFRGVDGERVQEFLRVRSAARLELLDTLTWAQRISLERLFLETLAALVFKYRWVIITLWMLAVALCLYGMLLLLVDFSGQPAPFDGFDSSEFFNLFG